MKTALTLIFSILTLTLIGNVRYVNFEQIRDYQKYEDSYSFVVDNEGYYNHWQPEWTFDVSKKSLVKGLKECYELFASLSDNDKTEINLLLGDISHYLYNLQEEKYFAIAEEHYKKAIELAPKDYRPLWFIANHYALSNVQDKSIEYFFKSQNLLPENEPAAFWEEFTFATAVANMPSHCIYAMDKAKSILEKPSYFEEQLGHTIYERITPVNSDSTYGFRDIWTASRGDLISFVSRPLGIKLLIDSTWQINFYDYKNRQGVVTIVPPAIPNESGREITYTIALIIKVAQQDDKLDDFIGNFVSRYTDKNNLDFSTKYPDMLSIELRDKYMYQDIGGAHMLTVGIEREKPIYPGLLLEQPLAIPQGVSNKVAFYQAGDSKDRFDGKIFYAVMLDACEDIYEEAYVLFKDTFEKQIVIE